MSAVIAGRALIKGFEVDGMLEGAILNESAVWDEFVLPGEAPDEAQADLCLWVVLLGAKLDDIAEALAGAVLAFDAIMGSFSV